MEASEEVSVSIDGNCRFTAVRYKRADLHIRTLFNTHGANNTFKTRNRVVMGGVIDPQIKHFFEIISSHSQEAAESCASWENAPRDLQHVCNAARFCVPG
jgi:hypothetical protein